MNDSANEAPRTGLDRIDQRILAVLQREGRISNVDLAERVALSPTPCLRRVKRLEEQGVIAGYRAELDRRALDLGVTAFVFINIERHGPASTQDFTAAALAIDQVVACHVLSGSFDFLLEVVACSLDDYAKVMLERLGGLPGVNSLQSCFALRTLKQGTELPLSHLAAGTRHQP